MSGALSKRQQARNEKALQDLVHNIPGNNQCADCHARNPAWASWSLGVFLCMRCAAIHRKLGTHISKVKSLSMDSWSNEQVDNMRKVGNVASNQIYNPESKHPPVPVDVDEADSAMERFIRQKYIHNVAAESRKPRSPRSEEGIPPPLPPKNSTKFGFRSASAIFPLSSRAKKEHRTASALSGGDVGSPTLTNKPSRLFGSSVDYDVVDDLDRKAARLREMGFQDNQRNAIVLKGVNGDMERAIEALVRLGEGRSRSPGPPPPPRDAVLRSVKSMTPLNSSSSGSPTLGLSLNVPQTSKADRPATSSTASTNPFDMMSSVAQPQTAQSTGSLHHKNPYSAVNNLFGPTPPQADLVSQAFHGLNLSTPQPTSVLPNHPGMTLQNPLSLAPQQHVSPSAPASPRHYQPAGFQNNASYPRTATQTLHLMQPSYNPFLSQPPSPTSISHTMMGNTPLAGSVNNPYTRSPTARIGSPTLGQIPEQSPSSFMQSSSFINQFPQHPQHLPKSANPFLANGHLQQLSLPQQSRLQPQTQTQTQQVPQNMSTFGPQNYANQQLYLQQPRHDKQSILALYNQPGSNFAPAAAGEPNLVSNTPSLPNDQASHAQSAQSSVTNQQSRGVSQPLPGNTNPFVGQNMAMQARHISRDSMNLGMDMAWTNGRHSPDAFASLSARHT
ncbi:hypothetical protein E4U42_007498 [Claviceps africana]|uniref:Uncharacterized protein n=1 Tax=Claviceps africana TaxID=83212 RepID=A0A8K0NNK5_9HYPO|nr:hypothetical protein E4U42_007498 [Claviceps africana]